jgi:aspartyl-tRNA(Asn)/glutamyl-tRNA(Gln) amidotransferase subunit B
MRSKEDAQDYRYFPDPDLLPVEIPAQWIEEVRRSMPKLPESLRHEYRERHALPAYDAALLTESREKSEFFNAVVAAVKVPAKTVAHWVNGEVAALLNDYGVEFAKAPVAPGDLARILELVDDKTISAKAAKEVLHGIARGDGDADRIVGMRGLRQISDSGALEAAVAGVLAAHPKLVEDYRAGKEKAFNALVGQVMKATKGQGNPQEVNRILRERLA